MASTLQQTLIFSLATAFAGGIFANNSCLSDPAVRERIANGKDLDSCFESDAGEEKCHFSKMSNREQAEVNGLRLIPLDRTTDKLLDRATGIISAKIFGSSSVKPSESSAQKISRCHVITSAHLIYTNSKAALTIEDIPSISDQRIAALSFHWGQSCDSDLFTSKTPATIFFKMTRRGSDIECNATDEGCEYGRFRADSDVIILRLQKYDKHDRTFFKLRTGEVQSSPRGRRVNCWGYPGSSHDSAISDKLSYQFLWHQTNAKIYQVRPWGIWANAVSYPGMSGGGCVFAEDPNRLVALIQHGGSPPAIVPGKDGELFGSTVLSPLSTLATRYKASTGKSIEDLDEECD